MCASSTVYDEVSIRWQMGLSALSTTLPHRTHIELERMHCLRAFSYAASVTPLVRLVLLRMFPGISDLLCERGQIFGRD